MSVIVGRPRMSEELDSAFCAAPPCEARATQGSPVPLCGRHLRLVYEFAQDIVDSEWSDKLAKAVEQTSAFRAPNPPLREVPSWVYFVQIGDLIKIGYSTYLKARFKVLRPDKVLAVMPGTMLDERRCHAAFAHLREHGEFFRPGADLLKFIEGLPVAG